MYTAAVLTDHSHNDLLNAFRELIPATWKIYCHHMTINLGPANDGPLFPQFNLGDQVELLATHYAYDDKVMAVKIETVVPSQNATKHITIAVNVASGKPFHSNQLKNWTPTSPIKLIAILEEVKN